MRIVFKKNGMLTWCCCRAVVHSNQKDMRLHLDKMARKCTATDMLYLVRLIKHDLRTNARASVVIGALGDGAYDAFKANKNLSTLLPKIVALTDDSSAAGDGGGGVGTGLARKLSSSMTIGQAVTPQLASAIKSTEAGFKKCPNGCFAEIKYEQHPCLPPIHFGILSTHGLLSN